MMDKGTLPRARIPVATYRVQFNRQFTFSSAREIVAYLNELGISDLYASSYVAAKAGSPHGYDVVNQTILNSEIGDEESHQQLVDELKRHDMGHILDFVPNHMCIESSENQWWLDVLENGPCSPYAQFFDIDWRPLKKELTNKVLLPFLADQYGLVLERGELRLVFDQGAFWILNSLPKIPVEPKSYLQILTYRLEELQQSVPADFPPLLELLSIITTLQHLPPTTEQDPDKREERYREKELVKKHLCGLCEQYPEIAGFIEDNIRIFNGTKGDPHSFDRLDGLLRDQVYRLSYWRVATEEINYRRFFDINGLAAIKMEDQTVFKETHPLLFRLIREGKVTGVRIDHVDGLYDPLAYLRSVQEQSFIQLRLADNPEQETSPEADLHSRYGKEYQAALEQEPSYKPLYLVCEKILMKGEQLPDEWPVFGTTGYDFLNYLNGIFVDTENARAFDRIYNRFTTKVMDFPEVVYEKKKLVMQVALAGEINMLGDQLNNISEQHRLTRDFTQNSLTRSISEVTAYFPVYRTYVNSWTVRDKDVQYIETAIAKAKRKNQAISASTFDFLRSVLLLKFPEYSQESDKRDWLSFAMKFQQVSGPVMAKGMEDTAFYIYNRLISLNDVGGMPGRFGMPMEAFHGHNLEKIKLFPHALITTATHDSKRGEDLRARVDTLSELPGRWQKSIAIWSRLNKKKCKLLDNQIVPDRNEEYLLYQTLIGAWPLAEMDQPGYSGFRTRIKEYMLKAVREAKVNTSWISTNSVYEEALFSFIEAILDDSPDNLFLEEFKRFQALIAHHAIFNSLSQTLLKIVSPGVPDFYQGTELWDLNLVDPDNRRPVDYAGRITALAGMKKREAEIGPRELMRELLQFWPDGRIKMFLIYRCLNYRKNNRLVFEKGDYLPLEAHGSKARHICAFSRNIEGKSVIAAAARFFTTLAPEREMLPLGESAWLDTTLMLPVVAGRTYRNIITDETIHADESGGMLKVRLAQLFGVAPVALLELAGSP